MAETELPGGHVYLSYVHEDSALVDLLDQALRAAGLPVWRDTADLWPGQDWRVKIRSAITDHSLAFLACFSPASVARATSYQNEELTLAIEEMRKRPPEVPWLIPVRLGDCAIPDRDVGAGRTLRSIQSADLFGPAAAAGRDRLIQAVRLCLGPSSLTGPLAAPAVAAPAVAATVHNEISGGVFFGQVIQGRDLHHE